MKLTKLIKVCLNETCSGLPVQNGLKGDALSTLLFNFALECAAKPGETEIELYYDADYILLLCVF
jgi:hypothetical protein